jgi:hypothetical protein
VGKVPGCDVQNDARFAGFARLRIPIVSRYSEKAREESIKSGVDGNGQKQCLGQDAQILAGPKKKREYM